MYGTYLSLPKMLKDSFLSLSFWTVASIVHMSPKRWIVHFTQERDVLGIIKNHVKPHHNAQINNTILNQDKKVIE